MPEWARSSYVLSVAFSPDGKTVATGTYLDDKVRIWDVESGAVLLTIPENSVKPILFSPDGNTLVVCRLVDISGWDVRNGESKWRLTNHMLLGAMADGSLMVINDEDGSWHSINTDTGTASRIQPSNEPPADLSIVSAEGRLGLGVSEGKIKLWSLPEGAFTVTLEGSEDLYLVSPSSRPLPSPALFLTDSNIVAGCTRGSARLWDTRTGSLIISLEETGCDVVDPIVFSPDGRIMATGSRSGEVKLWSVAWSPLHDADQPTARIS